MKKKNVDDKAITSIELNVLLNPWVKDTKDHEQIKQLIIVLNSFGNLLGHDNVVQIATWINLVKSHKDEVQRAADTKVHKFKNRGWCLPEEFYTTLENIKKKQDDQNYYA